ncbi:chromosomal replication initiator protein DnaA [Candidatus Dojkabacteria bacterium]|nr:chromosomal replication initiator protein DnaA [Candidatus Dojkabacteria bacterium]
MDINQIWKKTLAQIEIKLDSPAHFKTWFKDTRLKDINGKNAVIGVKNSYAGDWLSQKHRALIEKTLSFVYGKELTVEFVYDKELAENLQVTKSMDTPQEPILQVKNGIDEASFQRIKDSNLNERYSFNNFVVGASNRLAHAAAISVSENPGKSYNPFFIYGPTGVGKTHLIHAIGRSIMDGNTEKRVLYCTSENFLNDMVENIKANTMEKFRNKYRKLDALLIDDIQLLSNRRETQSIFFNTFNALFHESKQIIITSDRAPEEIPNVEKRLISRFQGGMVADISRPDYEERVAILEQKRKEYGIDLSDSILKAIAEISTDNIRELEGSLQKISLYNSMKKEGELTPAEIAKILGKDPNSKRKTIKISTIFKNVAKEFGVNAKDLKGPRRTKDIAFARQVCMYILRKELGYKFKEVSEILKRNDHTTAIHAIDKIESKMQANLTFSEQINNLIAEIYKPVTE